MGDGAFESNDRVEPSGEKVKLYATEGSLLRKLRKQPAHGGV
jgi:hypothetical protein